ncbi:hypothetical protein BROUX41_001518 [Berkeleyomyces rouxiae]|uniref:uncharacterized protein n=1 Tax=Berkeleyomyces rouxiae TaxID=2035830 RepID=UPI003B78159D
MPYRGMGVSPSLFVEKKRQSNDGSIANSESNSSPVTVYRTAPCSPIKSPDKSSFHMGHIMKENETCRSPSPSPGIPPALRRMPLVTLQAPINSSCPRGWGSPNISKSAIFPSSKIDLRGPSLRAPSPLVLVPQISVTPVVNVISEDCAVSLWVAVEVVAKLAAPASVDAFLMERPLDQQLCIGKRRRFEGQDGWYGCLYNLHVQFMPCPGTYIEEIIESEAPPVLATESSILYLVKVLMQPRPSMQRRRGFSRSHTSDDLFDDLELHLGNITRDYLVIRFSYNHTGFPNQTECQPQNSVRTSTSLDTVAIAVIRIGDVESGWSKKGSEDAKSRASFLDVVRGHGWDEELFEYAMQRIGPGVVTFPHVSMSVAENTTSQVGEVKSECPGSQEAVEEEAEEIQLPPISPTRLKLASICPLRRVRTGKTLGIRPGTADSTPTPSLSPNTAAKSPITAVKSPTKKVEGVVDSAPFPETKPIRRRKSWIFW